MPASYASVSSNRLSTRRPFAHLLLASLQSAFPLAQAIDLLEITTTSPTNDTFFAIADVPTLSSLLAQVVAQLASPLALSTVHDPARPTLPPEILLHILHQLAADNYPRRRYLLPSLERLPTSRSGSSIPYTASRSNIIQSRRGWSPNRILHDPQARIRHHRQLPTPLDHPRSPPFPRQARALPRAEDDTPFADDHRSRRRPSSPPGRLHTSSRASARCWRAGAAGTSSIAVAKRAANPVLELRDLDDIGQLN